MTSLRHRLSWLVLCAVPSRAVPCLRVHKHESSLKRLEALLGGANSSSELEGEWKEGGAALQLKLQKYREGAASRSESVRAQLHQQAMYERVCMECCEVAYALNQ